MSRKMVLGAVAAVGAAAFAFLVVVMALQGLAQAGAWAGPLAALAGIVAAVAAVWAVAPARREVALPPELQAPKGVVSRPAELAAVVRALVDARAGTVGITTRLYGAGGFGKTTLALQACADRRVRRLFGDRVYRVTVGRDLRGAANIALKVNDVVKLVTGEDASFADPQLAGQHLGSVLDKGPLRLLVLDDVWEPEQLAPFILGGRQCARLVTTRVPDLLAAGDPAVRVDQMSQAQARDLLDGTVRTWDAVTGRQRAVLTSHSRWVEAVAVAPDGSWLVCGSADDGTVQIWDEATGEERAVLTGHAARVTAVAVARDGRWLATGGDDGTVRVWDTARWNTQAMMRTDSVGIDCAWLGSDRLIVSGSAGMYLFGFLTEDHVAIASNPPPQRGLPAI